MSYPRVIEDALYEHPAVAEAVVIGVSRTAIAGRRPSAFVSPRPRRRAYVDEAGLSAFLGERVNKIEMPRERSRDPRQIAQDA